MNKTILMIVVTIAVSTVIATSFISKAGSVEQTKGMDQLDSTILLLEGKRIPVGNFIMLYNTTPKIITSGIIVLKLPCDDDANPKGWRLYGGTGPEVMPLRTDLVLSTPQNLCVYRVDIPNKDVPAITNVILFNISDGMIRFPPASSAVITVTSIQPTQGQQG